MGEVVPIRPEQTEEELEELTAQQRRRQQQEDYVEWLTTPKSERDPKTKKELADLFGVVFRTLNYWDKDPWVMKQVQARIKNNARVQDSAEVIQALFTTATDLASPRHVSAAKVWLDYTSEKVDDLTAEDLAELSDEELMNVLADLHDMVESRVDGE